jgi:outer membrane protein assembly factor BamD (BamD/ComL family)
LDEEYLRSSYLFRAGCQYDLAQYAAAIKEYEGAASRFAGSLTAVQAYVQVVNSHLALNQVAQARAAAERARWLLQKIPDDAFGHDPLALSRQYYSDLLDLRRFGP